MTAKPPATLNCASCQSPFTPTRGWQRFCGKKCRAAFHQAVTEAEIDSLEAEVKRLLAENAQLRSQLDQK